MLLSNTNIPKSLVKKLNENYIFDVEQLILRTKTNSFTRGLSEVIDYPYASLVELIESLKKKYPDIATSEKPHEYKLGFRIE